MPAKKHRLTEEQRRENIREAAQKISAEESDEALDRAFKKIVPPKRPKPRA